MRKILKYYVTAIIIAVFGALTVHTSAAQSSSDAYQVEVFETSLKPVVNISTSGGFIEVLGSDSNEVTVEMFVKKGSRYLSPSDTDLSDYEVEISKTGDSVTAESKSKGSWIFSSNRNLSISFRVTVPLESVATGRTSGGSVSAENLLNGVDLRTSGGSVSAKNVEGEVSLRTSGGSINLDNVFGTIDARTSGGSISAQNLVGNANLRTSGGSIRLDDITARISAKTSGGSITGNFLAIENDIELSTSGGNIQVEIPGSVDFDIDLRGGRVDAPLRNFTGEVERNHVKGSIGNGGPIVSAKTSGGTVRLRYK